VNETAVEKYQATQVTRYLAEPDAVPREARERALRSSRSVVNQARAVFKRDKPLRNKYAERKIILPQCVDDFLTCPLLGKKIKKEYLAPASEVVEAAFADIDKFLKLDPNIWLAFWLAVGAGLRRGEIRAVRWEHVIQRGEAMWISGGIGKDGEKIEVPIQARAWEQLKTMRRESGPILIERGLSWARRINFWMKSLGWNTQKKLHELRAYIGSLIYQKNPVAAMKFMRHKSIAITEKYYCRYGTEQKIPDVL
jgi:integrase